MNERPVNETRPRFPRRAAIGALLGAGLASIASLVLARGVAAPSRKEKLRALVLRAHDLSKALAEGRISPREWQDSMDRLFRPEGAAELARAMDLDALVAHAPGVELGASVVPVDLAPGGDLERGFATKLFLLKKGRANPPHAHENMVSMHYVLTGRFRVRHFDRIRDEPGCIVLKPTIDRVLGPGEGTSISDAHDNVHWHVAEEDGVLLDVVRAGLFGRPTETPLVDPLRAEALPDGLLRAPVIPTVEEALSRFG